MRNQLTICFHSLLFGIILMITSCGNTPEITDDLLDGQLVFDSSVLYPERYLVSVGHPNPTADERTRPVIIMCHGYSASTFEWQEFVDWSVSTEEYFVSRVLLGGHGRSYTDFKSSTWLDWQQAIFDEYEELLNAGYTNLHLVGSSTSGALILEALASGYFEDKVAPASVLLIDPIVIPSAKILPLIGVLGPLIGYSESDNTDGEKVYWYTYRPQKTLQELQSVIKKVRKDLQRGFTLDSDTYLKVYKCTSDSNADPVSAVLIYKGITQSYSGQVEVEMIDSDLHVFTRLKHREETISDGDRLLQEQ
ncbi:MAG: esterase, partial [Marinoscillum sp.]